MKTVHVMKEFLEEIRSLIEADDGLVFQVQHIEMLEELEELIDGELNGHR